MTAKIYGRKWKWNLHARVLRMWMKLSYASVLIVVAVVDADLWFVIQDSSSVSVSQCEGDKGHLTVHRKHHFWVNKETHFLINFISNAI